MKKFYLYIIIGIGLMLTACDMERSDNGDLDGFWQMTSKIDKSAKCGAVDMRDSGITWSFQEKLLELHDVKKVHQDIIGDFVHQGGTLSVSRFYFVDRDKGDVRIDDPISYLVPYGVAWVHVFAEDGGILRVIRLFHRKHREEPAGHETCIHLLRDKIR